MQTNRTTTLATLFVLMTGTLWGLYWLPVRRLADLGLQGAWGTVAICLMAMLILAPFAWRGRDRLRRASGIGLASVALGGFAFALYSIGFLYGRVAIIVILFFLTPVWSTLIGRFVMGWPTSRMRIAALAVGLAGLLLILGADGEWPWPRGLGEWLALASGILWSVATTGIRAKSDTGPGETAFVFAAGSALGALILAPMLEPLPAAISQPGLTLAWALAAGGLWWGLSMAGLMWATARLEPARVGILLMAEVLVSATSAALIAGEHLGALEVAGGTLVVLAGVLEIWPQRKASGGTA
ncbi:DMT family transporter [Tabrizicola sp.]|uniref:DMT family transporter n=1 Tax=Tabrizicola sp. TaxID=2005166 RepID=UPI00286C113F|nr:DMT family transporter [Tabrizicola sp.]